MQLIFQRGIAQLNHTALRLNWSLIHPVGLTNLS